MAIPLHYREDLILKYRTIHLFRSHFETVERRLPGINSHLFILIIRILLSLVGSNGILWYIIPYNPITYISVMAYNYHVNSKRTKKRQRRTDDNNYSSNTISINILYTEYITLYT